MKLFAITTAMTGFMCATIPLYKIYCSTAGLGGVADKSNHRKYPQPDAGAALNTGSQRKIRVSFDANVQALPWDFYPEQKDVSVRVGETSLVFYKAVNKKDKPMIGMSVYSIDPPEAGLYFNKIQCFCFEEQLLNPQEAVDMPVFFFIDPDFAKDPRMRGVSDISLSYNFFESASEIPATYLRPTPTSKMPAVL